ncbi:antibiotic biosynthesis monooxygenase family protein [Virgibacillus sp. W0430]|uniref:antibiotic biosynthesis monooxygenase family protein n=1 Tax=Virgibacillus sp. W0430 TaxID=3391580 RepID=UPI003F48DA1C
MNAYMTTGTIDFLKQLERKYKAIPFHFMSNPNGALAYYEGKGKSVFQSGRTYHVLLSKGEISEKGYVVMNNIPVTEEGRPVFEDLFDKRQNEMDKVPGFHAFRLLQPNRGNTYVVFTQWSSEVDYLNWKDSDAFKNSHSEHAVKPPAYFADRPFVSTYDMIAEDEDA